MKSKQQWGYLIGICCFAIHLGLTVTHTYFFASRMNTIQAPTRADDYLDRWHNVLDLNRWDAGQYDVIVRIGYKNPEDPRKPLATIQWYPGYPLLAKGVRALTGWSVSQTFSLLSATFTLAFWMLLWSPAFQSILGKKTLAVTSLFIVIWPGAFFWFAGMTEPLVGLLLLVILHLWWGERSRWLTLVLAYSTAVKQVFVPVSLAIVGLDFLKHRPAFFAVLLRGLLALTGFIAFGVYSWINFGNFFMSSDLATLVYAKKPNLFNLIDLHQYAAFFGSLGGQVAFWSMILLLWEALRWSSLFKKWRGLFSWRESIRNIPPSIVLWWFALASTAFFVLGDSRTQHPFASMLRYQTTNVPLFLLCASYFQNLAWWKMGLLGFPIAWICLYWQNHFVVVYWNWGWVA